MPENTRFETRRLSADDVDLFRQLLATFGRAFDDTETYEGAQPRKTYLEGLLGSDQFIALAALAGDRVVGGLAAYELKKFEQERTELYIYDLAVDESYRRRGLAIRLIEHLKKTAVNRGIYVIFVQADLGDDAAISLYTKLGIREDVLHFDIAPS